MPVRSDEMARDYSAFNSIFRERLEGSGITFVEVWDSVETHKASVEGITPEQLEEVTRLLAGPPQGRYLAE